MLGEIVSRRIVLRTAAFGVIAGGLAACAISTSGTASGAVVSGSASGVTMITPTEVAAQASTVLSAISGAVVALSADLPATVTGNIAKAESAAASAIAAIPGMNLSSIPAAALSIATTLAGIVAAVPGLPVAVVAAVTAFQVLAAALTPLVNGAPVTAMGATLPVGGARVYLVPNL
jgi:hypothetical protein